MILTAVAATLVVLGGGAYLWIRSRAVAPPPAQTTEPAPTAEVVPVPPPETPHAACNDPECGRRAANRNRTWRRHAAATGRNFDGSRDDTRRDPGVADRRAHGIEVVTNRNRDSGRRSERRRECRREGPRNAGGTAAPTTPAVTPTTPATPANDPLVAFNNVKLYVVTGKRGDDRDVLLNFAGGQMTILPKNGGEALIITQYRNVAKATYVKGRDPRWDAGLTAPPEGLDVGSMFRQSRHWLVVQTRGQLHDPETRRRERDKGARHLRKPHRSQNQSSKVNEKVATQLRRFNVIVTSISVINAASSQL